MARYLLGAALVLAGAGYLGLRLAASLAGPEDIFEKPLVEQLRLAVTGADPKQLAVGGALALAGLLLARPVFSISIRFGRRRKARRGKKLSLEQAVEELRSADPEVRLDAVNDLLSAAAPSTIPALVRALGDPTTKVRGQACEALANMTGETFDFVDIAPESVRAESVAAWKAWWRENKEAILSGTDPRDVAGKPTGVAASAVTRPAAASPSPRSPATRPAASRGSRPSAGRTARTAAVRRPSPARERAPASDAGTPAKPGRQASIGEIVRRKRMRQAEGAAEERSRFRPVGTPPQPAAPPEPAAPAEPAVLDAGGSSGLTADADEPLPSPDDVLPSLDDDLPSLDDELPPLDD
jgi:hypothetical protein